MNFKKPRGLRNQDSTVVKFLFLNKTVHNSYFLTIDAF